MGNSQSSSQYNLVTLRVSKANALPKIWELTVNAVRRVLTSLEQSFRNETIHMHPPSFSMATGYAFDGDYISIHGDHDLQDILLRIGMPTAAARFANLWVKLNPFVDCNSPAFLAEVWGVGKSEQEEPQCLYRAPADHALPLEDV